MHSWWMIAVLVMIATTVWAKTGRNYYTPQRLQILQNNLQQHEWAQAERDRIISEADRWVKYDDERLRDLVPPPEVPRASRVSINECPVHGQEILKVASMYGWKMDFDTPYKVFCPLGGEAYPSNDFYAYLKGGMKDKSLLTGEYVDDGWGYQKNPDDKYNHWFVAYYAHWMVRNYLLPALENLSRAYLITGDTRYAHKCSLLLWQLAYYYPDYCYEKQSNYGKEINPQYYGRLLYHTWENYTVQQASRAYDAVFPALADDTELQQLAGVDGAGLAQYIEERLLRTMGRDIIDGSHRIQGNYGMHHESVLLVALVLADSPGDPSSKQMVDWVVSNPEPASLYTDTAFEDMIINLIQRDGIPFESPSYNSGWQKDLALVAELLQQNGYDYWQNPRFQRIYLAPLERIVAERFTMPSGDSNNLFSGAIGWEPAFQEVAFRQMKTPLQAHGMLQSRSGFSRDLFQESMLSEARELAARQPAEIGRTSTLLPGLGHLTLQTAQTPYPTGLAFYYGYYTAHAHYDGFNVDFYAEGNPLTPDLGYPETADSFDPRRFGLLSHTAVHNTCMVNARRQEFARGELVAFHPGSFAQMAEATSPGLYPEVVKDYRRAVMLVEASPSQAYYVDFFHVDGGSQHDWIVHGNEAEFDASLPLSAPRADGTLAGPDVPYGHFYDDEQLKPSTYGLPYSLYKGSAFQWFTNVQEAEQKAEAGEAPWVRWTLTRDPDQFPNHPTRGVALRSHLLPAEETVYACDAVPQRRKNFPETLKWVFRRRQAAEGELQSTFVTVHEGYRDTPFIQSVKPVEVTPATGKALAVELDQRRQIVFWSYEPQTTHTLAGGIQIRGRGAVVELGAGDVVLQARLFDGELIKAGEWQLTGDGVREVKVKAVDYAKGEVTLEDSVLKESDQLLWAPCHSPRHEATVQVTEVLAADRLSLGDQDLRTGRGAVLFREGERISTNALMYFVFPGMTVVNEKMEPVARLVRRNGLSVHLDQTVEADTFPDDDGDGRARFWVMAIGPGDLLKLGSTASYQAAP